MRKSFISKSFLFGTLLLITQSIFAQNNNNRFVNKTEQQWVQYYSESILNEKWSIPFDLGFRWRNNFKQSSQYLVRGAISYKINDRLSVAAGFGHLGYYSGNNVNATEARPHQEISYKHNLGTIGIGHRVRIEQRFVTRNANTANSIRYRYSLMFNLFSFPISTGNPDLQFVFRVGNEIFLNTGNDDLETAFSQNRFMISPTIQFSDQFKVNLTWNSQYAATDDDEVFDQTDVLWIQVRHKLNW